MNAPDYADLWDTPDAKRERSSGKWDVYCAECGRFVDSVHAPVMPHSVRCRRCREGLRGPEDAPERPSAAQGAPD